jgi:hypothetical protein
MVFDPITKSFSGRSPQFITKTSCSCGALPITKITRRGGFETRPDKALIEDKGFENPNLEWLKPSGPVKERDTPKLSTLPTYSNCLRGGRWRFLLCRLLDDFLRVQYLFKKTQEFRKGGEEGFLFSVSNVRLTLV